MAHPQAWVELHQLPPITSHAPRHPVECSEKYAAIPRTVGEQKIPDCIFILAHQVKQRPHLGRVWFPWTVLFCLDVFPVHLEPIAHVRQGSHRLNSFLAHNSISSRSSPGFRVCTAAPTTADTASSQPARALIESLASKDGQGCISAENCVILP
jgi:hypothetical protein